MVYNAIDVLSNMTRTTCAYGLWIESRYVDQGWGWVIYDWHVYDIAYCLFMIIR
jgi:hypothetical protein